jgi:secondary thiamine-phosphate synthase enzyme
MERAATEVMTRREGVAASSGPAISVHCEALVVSTGEAPEFIDITEDVQRIVDESRALYGQATVFSSHTTAAIRVNENEPLLLQDMKRILHEVAPSHGEYEHNDFSRRAVVEEDECANGHAHCQHLFLSTSETLPILDGRLALGQWQRVFLVELDHPRQRRVLVNVLGVGR